MSRKKLSYLHKKTYIVHSVKIKKLKSFFKNFSFPCFLMKMLLKGVVFFQKIRLYLIFLLRFRSIGNGKYLFLCLSA